MEGTTGSHENVELLGHGEKGVVIPAFSTPCKPEPEIYYGVYVPDTSEAISDQVPECEKVYTDKAACLAVMKKCRGSRFKSFSTYEEALEFAENGPVITLPQNFGEEGKCSSLNAEKPSPYRGPKSQDLVKFRKAIEKADMAYFDQCLDENPRYLVSSGDTPAILQEGSRYNALHVACRTDKPEYVHKVLTVVADVQFFQKLYPDDTLESSERRSRYLLDAYLNTPDKGLNETPLHFASKHGSVGCVRILTSHPDCCKKRRNKFSQTALEIVGSRAKSISKQDTNLICTLLGDHYYVPLLRDDDLCMLPQVGEPWSPKQDSPGLVTEEKQLIACLSPGSSDSPLSPITPTLKVRGYAGPMSPSQAESFYRRWRETGVMSPTRSSRTRAATLRLTDHEKGLERVGRELASTSGHSWSEYWDFLGEFTNMASDEGLVKLEKHLKQKFRQLTAEQSELDASDLRNKLSDLTSLESSDKVSSQDNSKSQNLEDSDLSRASHSTMGELCQELEALRLNASLSPQLDTAGQPVISASSKFLQSWRDREQIKDAGDDVVDRAARDQDPDVQHLSYITKSIHVSAFRLSEVLGDLARELQSSRVTNLSVGKTVRTKLRPEILCLRDVVCKCFRKEIAGEIDCSFVHILLAFKATEYVQQNLTPSDLCVLAETLRIVVSNLNFVSANSSDEEDSVSAPESNQERRENASHVSCVLRALEKALTVAYNNCSSDISIDDNGNTLSMMQLGDCTCRWNARKEKMDKDVLNSTPASNVRYNKAFSFLHNSLFTDSKKREMDQNKINSNQVETVVKQLTFEENGEKVIKATLTIGNRQLGQTEVPEKTSARDDDDDNDSFATAASSVEDYMITPEEGLKVYIYGSEASKTDADVLSAIEGMDLDESKYPYIAQWLYLVNSHSEDQRKRWTTPRVRNYSLSLPRMSNPNIGTPLRNQKSWIPSSAPRTLFGKQRDHFTFSPS